MRYRLVVLYLALITCIVVTAVAFARGKSPPVEINGALGALGGVVLFSTPHDPQKPGH